MSEQVLSPDAQQSGGYYRMVAALGLSASIFLTPHGGWGSAYEAANDAQPAAVAGCLEPSADDFAAVDQMLIDPPDVPSILHDSAAMFPDRDEREAYALYLGGDLRYSTFRHALKTVPPTAEGTSELPEKTLLFETVQNLTKEYYGIDLQLIDKDMVIRTDLARLTETEMAVAEAAVIDDLDIGDIHGLSRAISLLPADIVKASEVKKIVLYNSKPDAEGNRILGFVNGTHTLHLDIKSKYGVLEHELGHEIIEALCADAATDAGFTSLNNGLFYTGSQIYLLAGLENVLVRPMSEETFDNQHGTDMLQKRNMRDTDPGNDLGASEVYEQLAVQHPDDAERVIATSEYGLKTEKEDKAELYKVMVSGSVSGGNWDLVMVPGKPVARKMRYLLAQLHAVAPKGVHYLIRINNTPESESRNNLPASGQLY